MTDLYEPKDKRKRKPLWLHYRIRSESRVRLPFSSATAFNSSGDPGDGPLLETECEAVAADNARRSEAWPGASAWVQAGEYEIIPFAHFSLSRLHPPELGLGRRVVEKPVGFRRKDLLEVALAALRLLNASPTLRRLSLEDFLEGVYRTEPTSGTHYELFFRVSRGLSPPPVARVTLVRPFAPLRPTGAPEVRSQRPLVHVVLPLPYNCPHSVFESFMDKFARIAIRNDRKVTLTVAHFGGGGVGLAAARRVMVRVSKDTRFRGMRLLALNTTTSRTAALHAAVEACCTIQPPNNSPVENSVVQKHSGEIVCSPLTTHLLTRRGSGRFWSVGSGPF
ncbi:hypothetical protein J437_LFUL010703 [Ladona fulva]|uniref:Hexosyltransferase n=1 Tax=Ladona fulva TaxID=123851 RepID=A0A8K0K9X2_LADFU|nr:hypothetical protein J437_LFUL010703 [Ladona fulva]